MAAPPNGQRILVVDDNPFVTALLRQGLSDEGYEVVAASTPVVVSVWDTINEPRYPSFKGIMAAKKKPVQTLSLADLGFSDGVGPASSEVLEHSRRPPRHGGNTVADSGDGGTQLVAYLAVEKFV